MTVVVTYNRSVPGGGAGEGRGLFNRSLYLCWWVQVRGPRYPRAKICAPIWRECVWLRPEFLPSLLSCPAPDFAGPWAALETR